MGGKLRFRSLGFVLLLCLGLAAGFAEDRDTAAEKSRLIALENAWNQAQIHRDAKALEGLLADTFVYTDWDGTVMNKAQYLTDLRDPSVVTTLVANDRVEVYLYSGVAVVTGSYRTKGTNQGKPFDHRGRFTDTWIFSDGKWQCVATHTNLMKS